ncbi:MAG TPA: BlaI/MecI/CopY family transcriptional regulator [Vicinamibacterales bacterium]|nr:BlaI/MecI/CopY family transcriptional regulator [Vicinamibacterales bacterium]
MKFLFWGFKSSREFLENSLGALERSVMSLAWQRAEISVRDACEKLGSSVAYTTVMTTMDRLFKKGLLDRRKVGRAFVYRAVATQQQIENAVLSSLVDAVSEQDRALLDELERLVREKRRQLDANRGR